MFADSRNRTEEQSDQEYHPVFQRENLGSYSLRIKILGMTEALGESNG